MSFASVSFCTFRFQFKTAAVLWPYMQVLLQCCLLKDWNLRSWMSWTVHKLTRVKWHALLSPFFALAWASAFGFPCYILCLWTRPLIEHHFFFRWSLFGWFTGKAAALCGADRFNCSNRICCILHRLHLCEIRGRRSRQFIMLVMSLWRCVILTVYSVFILQYKSKYKLWGLKTTQS